MMIKVKYGEDKDIFLNSDCPVRVLQNCIHDLLTQSESINNLSSISNTFEVDLCDENGQLKNLSSLDPWANGYESGIFIFRATYTVVILERDESGSITKIQPTLNKNTRQYSDMMLKIKRHLAPSSKVLKLQRFQSKTGSKKLKKGSDRSSMKSSSHTLNLEHM